MATHKLDKYRAEAEVPPFELEFEDGKTTNIAAPTGEVMMLIGETPVQDSRRMMQLLCGDQYEILWEVLGKEQAGVVQALVIDMIKHFKIDAAAALPGGSRALPR